MYPSDKEEITLSDGYKAACYTFTLGDKNKTDTIIFAIQGSDNASAQVFRFLLKDYPGNCRVYTLQKRYLKHNSSPYSKPPQDFYRFNYFSQWKRDQIEYINHILTNQDFREKKIILLGMSEGGAVAPAIAAQVPQVDYLVVLGDGGMKGLDAFRIWGKKNGTDFDDIYKVVKADPASDKFIGPYTYRYWQEALDEEPLTYLVNLNIPMFYAMGEKDGSVPLESLYYLRNEFAQLNKNNLVTKIYPDCKHDLEDSKGNSHLKEFMQDVYELVSRDQ